MDVLYWLIISDRHRIPEIVECARRLNIKRIDTGIYFHEKTIGITTNLPSENLMVRNLHETSFFYLFTSRHFDNGHEITVIFGHGTFLLLFDTVSATA